MVKFCIKNLWQNKQAGLMAQKKSNHFQSNKLLGVPLHNIPGETRGCTI